MTETHVPPRGRPVLVTFWRPDRSEGGGGARFVLVAAALVVVVFAVFGEVRSFGFLDYDDGDYVFRNLHLLPSGPSPP